MIVALILVSIALIVFIVYLVISSKSKASSPAVKPRSAPPAPNNVANPSTPDDDDEATRVRVAGPRLIRTMGGLRVGDELPISGFMTIGRGQSCTLKFNDAEMSSTHAEFRVEGDKAVVIDLASTNGTFLNSERIDPNVAVNLTDGDQIKLGTTIFVFKKYQ